MKPAHPHLFYYLMLTYAFGFIAAIAFPIASIDPASVTAKSADRGSSTEQRLVASVPL